MRKILITEINKEKCNAAALGLFNSAMSSGAFENAAIEEAKLWNAQIEDDEKKGKTSDKKIEKLLKEEKNIKNLLEVSIKEAERFDKAGNISARNQAIDTVNTYKSMLAKTSEKLHKAQVNRKPNSIKREIPNGSRSSWELSVDSYVKKSNNNSFNDAQKRALHGYKGALNAVDKWKSDKTISAEKRADNVKYFTNLKLKRLQEIKRQFKLSDFK
ncbi:hypothetical protein [Elizabethkingia meningoseptica]|uniref:hypothetical protein n=1 Tax=Elizabethkingia meningoseptica TaxID=238 RepID=UPI003891BA27